MSYPPALETNFSNWYKINTINKYEKCFIQNIVDNDYYEYEFTNSDIYNSGDQVDLARPFDYIPIIAGEQELIEKNRILYADILEGYDNVNLDVFIASNKS